MWMCIDCEFNDFGGKLISMAIVTGDGQEFYEVVPCSWPTPWVRENVMPVLEKEPIEWHEFKEKFRKFIEGFDRIHLIADWPDDIKYFCEELVTGPGTAIRYPNLTMSIDNNLSSEKSAVPHNALHDARAIKAHYEELYGE